MKHKPHLWKGNPNRCPYCKSIYAGYKKYYKSRLTDGLWVGCAVKFLLCSNPDCLFYFNIDPEKEYSMLSYGDGFQTEFIKYLQTSLL